MQWYWNKIRISGKYRIKLNLLANCSLFLFFVSLFTLLLSLPHAFGASVSLSWAPSSNVTGYKIYYGLKSGSYDQMKGDGIDAGTGTSYQINNLPEEKTYYFALAAYDSTLNEGDFSTEAAVFLPAATTDSDKDGVPDVNETANGTDPNNPGDNLPIANAGADKTTTPAGIILDGSASSDPNNDPLQYFWSLSSGPAAVPDLPSDSSVKPVVLLSKSGGYTFELTVNDGKTNSLPDTVLITITNIKPVADAGTDQTVNKGALVTLHGIGSTDSNGDAISYLWRQISGASISLSDNYSINPSFTADSSGVYSFGLTVNDGAENSIEDTVTVIVNDPNTVPTANAGPDQSVYLQQQVILDGSASRDGDSQPLTYKWSYISGPSSTIDLSADNIVNPSFIPPVPGVYIISLVVNDGINTSLPDEVSIKVNEPPYMLPVANAGDDITVTVGETVTLGGGESSSSNSDILYFKWTQLSGPAVTLSDITSMTPTFTPGMTGIYTFELRVSDGKAESLPDEVSVTVNGANKIPVANAGEDQNINVGNIIFLNGTASSDADGGTLQYFWTQTEGTNVSLSDLNAAAPYFEPAVSGIYGFDLVVYDGTNYSAPDNVTITINKINNNIPVAKTKKYLMGQTNTAVILDGTGSSDPDGNTLTYNWTQLEGPTVILDHSETATASFLPEYEGKYIFGLTVNDGQDTSIQDKLEVYVADKINVITIITSSMGGTVSGSVEGLGEIQLMIPPLTGDITVSIGETSLLNPFSGNISPVGKVLNLEPRGTVFENPVNLKILLDSGGYADRQMVAKSYNESTRTWNEIPIVEQGDAHLLVQVSTLSKIAVGVYEEGSTPVTGSAAASAGGGCGFIKPTNGSQGPGDGSFMLMLISVMLLPFLRRLVYQIKRGSLMLNKGILSSGVLCILLLLSSYSFAATYYIDAVSGSDGNNGSSASPWKTLNKARKSSGTVAAGDTVILKAGTYAPVTFSGSDSGTASAPITYQNADSNAVINGNGGAGLTIDAYHLVFDGIKVINAKENVKFRQGGNIYLKNCELSGSLLYGGITFVDSDAGAHSPENITVENCYIHDNGLNIQDHGIYVADGKNIKLLRNRIINNYGTGILIQPHTNATQNRYDIVDGIIVEGNQVSGNTTGIACVSYGGARSYNMLLKNNLSWKNKKNGIQTEFATDIYNNTLWSNGQGGITIYALDPTKNTNIVNNLLNGNGTDGSWGSGDIKFTSTNIDFSKFSTFKMNNNIYSTMGSSHSDIPSAIREAEKTDNIFGVNPQLASIDPNNTDFLKILSVSPAINTGITLAAVTIDHWSAPRTDGKHDIGAHEFGGKAAPVVLNITTASLSDGMVNTTYSQTLQATGGTSPYTWKVTSGTLPAGLALSTSGAISGTPSTSQQATFTVAATDSTAVTVSKSLGIKIAPEPAKEYIIIEGEKAVISSVFQTGSDSKAFKGAYIYSPASTPATSTPVSEASFSITVPTAGNYYLWARLYGETGSNDAIYIGFNNKLVRSWPSVFGKYDWARIDTAEDAGIYAHALTTGTNTINIGHGEPLARVDRLLVTNDPAYNPSNIPVPGKPAAK